MRLYLDDDSADGLLVRLLVGNGHDVQIPLDVGLSGQEDVNHFMHAIAQNRVLLTHNHDDFKRLHELVLLVAGHYPGLFIVCKENNPARDLRPRGVAQAVENLLASGIPIPDQLHILNQWR